MCSELDHCNSLITWIYAVYVCIYASICVHKHLVKSFVFSWTTICVYLYTNGICTFFQVHFAWVNIFCLQLQCRGDFTQSVWCIVHLEYRPNIYYRSKYLFYEASLSSMSPGPVYFDKWFFVWQERCLQH